MTCQHGGGPPTNATATPTLRNITIRNMHLTGVMGDGFGAPRLRLPHGYQEPVFEPAAQVGRGLSCAYVSFLPDTTI